MSVDECFTTWRQSLLLFLYIKLRSGGEVEDYIKCELIGEVTPKHLSISTLFSNLFIVACTLHAHQYMLCIVAIVDCTCTPCCPLQNNQHIPDLARRFVL